MMSVACPETQTDQPTEALLSPMIWPLNPSQACLGEGPIWHARTRPKAHAFRYSAYFLMIPMRARRAALAEHLDGAAFPSSRSHAAFCDQDHGMGQADALAWAEACWKEAGIDTQAGEIWLQTLPRVMGYVFKPVSFWYWVDEKQQLRSVLAEVNNTFGERHVYLLDQAGLAQGAWVQARKVFHVSPFCDISGHYRFRFQFHAGEQGIKLSAEVHLYDDDFPASHACTQSVVHEPNSHESHYREPNAMARLLTCWQGVLQPYTPALARKLAWQHPLQSVMVIVRIHWQALKLWRKRLPFFRQPPAPNQWITR